MHPMVKYKILLRLFCGGQSWMYILAKFFMLRSNDTFSFHVEAMEEAALYA
jgi:hypothetical protein